MVTLLKKTFIGLFEYSDDVKKRHFSKKFTSDNDSVFLSESVEFDQLREGLGVSIPVQGLDTGYRLVDSGDYLRIEVKPPIFKDRMAVKGSDILKVAAGETEYDAVTQAKTLFNSIMSTAASLGNRHMRSVELMASQVLTEGEISLVDANGNVQYAIDFNPKASHFVTVANSWSGGSATIEADISALSDTIQQSSGRRPNELHLGTTAATNFFKDAGILAKLDNRRIEIGKYQPSGKVTDEGSFVGKIFVGFHEYNVYVYSGEYEHPQTGNLTRYLPADYAVLSRSDAKLKMLYGNIPHLGTIMGVKRPADTMLKQLRSSVLSGSAVDGGAFVNMHLNPWISEDGEVLNLGVGMRPLPVPMELDSFGRLDTVP